jgi:hypothetical protein
MTTGNDCHRRGGPLRAKRMVIIVYAIVSEHGRERVNFKVEDVRIHLC